MPAVPTRDVAGPAKLREAFTGQGWPWVTQDPHRTAYRRWVEGLPGLPAEADTLLRARQRAVDTDRDDGSCARIWPGPE